MQIDSGGYQSRAWRHSEFLEEVPAGPQQKGESFIFIIIPCIGNPFAEYITILVMGTLSVMKHLKTNSGGGPWDTNLSNRVCGLICVKGVLDVIQFKNHWYRDTCDQHQWKNYSDPLLKYQ